MNNISLNAFKEFFSSKSAGGTILILCVILSLFIANSPLAGSFSSLLAAPLGGSAGAIHLEYPLLVWINDGLMAIFFLHVGLEIKRELIEGELSSPKQAALPVFAAIGGMAVPALIFGLLNNNTSTANGWGIPMATDIAFAIGLLSILGDRVPTSLKVFLTALAIVDDLGAILVIAIFYSSEIHVNYLAYAGGIVILLLLLNRLNVKIIYFYIIPGLFMWYFIHHSGIHATIAGVVTALTIPTTPDNTPSPLERLEHALTKPVNFLIMPVFALANTNISVNANMLNGIFTNMGMGILFGLLVGKPIGIFIMSWAAVKTGLGSMPAGSRWSQIFGLGILAGIGFTMSIFIAMLSYSNPAHQTDAKFVILVASMVAGIVGFVILKWNYKLQLQK